MGVKFFLIRHGETVWNKEGKYQGDMDTRLTSLGIRQAKLAAKYLSPVNFSAIYSSPLKRTLDTAKIISKSKNIEIKILENLREINFGNWEGLTFNEINKKYHNEYQAWLEDPYHNSPPDGESFKSLTVRSTGVVEKMLNENEDGSDIAVVTHGGIIVSLLIYWLNIPVSRWRSIIQRHGAINVVVIEDDFPYISMINYTGHLKPVYNHRDDKVIDIYSRVKEK